MIADLINCVLVSASHPDFEPCYESSVECCPADGGRAQCPGCPEEEPIGGQCGLYCAQQHLIVGPAAETDHCAKLLGLIFQVGVLHCTCLLLHGA